MDIEQNLILIRDEDKTREVQSCTYNKGKWEIKFNGRNRVYTYNYLNVKWYRNPVKIDPHTNILYEGQKPITGVTKILKFDHHIRLIFNRNYTMVYNKSAITIEATALHNKDKRTTFQYLTALANNVNGALDEGPSFLGKVYDSITQISPRSILSNYLSGKQPKIKESCPDLIYPFGFNESQKAATKRAFTNQLSIIEGPPGTGKTQTILNIIANAILRNETVAVVSNNNSATSNVFEKLEQNGFDFLAAYLGNRENQETFFQEQTGTYPDMNQWDLTNEELQPIKIRVKDSQQKLTEMLNDKNKHANLKQQISDLQTENKYFNLYFSESKFSELKIKSFFRFKADHILRFLIRYQQTLESGQVTFGKKLYNLFAFGVYNFSIYKHDPNVVVSFLQKEYYETKLKELQSEIEMLERKLDNYDFENNMKQHSEDSMKLFQATLANAYSQRVGRTTFDKDALWKNFDHFINEYPVILSTTHSLRNSAARNYLFDYVLIDEASQVDLVTGALALSCAKNAVIVGDLMQLPHVVPNDVKDRTQMIFESYHLDEAYNYADQNLLSSINSLFNDIPKTLLKEHYRCHPKIIGYCNQKFYNNELVVLTNELEVEHPLILYETVKGNHARGTINERQVDVIYNEIIPKQKINPSVQSVGVIAPYRDQADMLQDERTHKGIEVDTVHKYQGQEKDIIILSTVSNHIEENDFVDNTNLINVAVSRAVKQLIVVVADGSEDWNKTNIGDLVRYIRYNNFDIIESEIRSVFDLLYKDYSDQLLKAMKNNKQVSEHKSENLMNIIIEKVLNEHEFISLSHVLHQPLRMLIKDPYKLTDEERKYAMNILTHTDFVIYNNIDKMPVLVIEVDGHAFHANNPIQLKRDEMKDRILEKYGIPIVRMKTTGSEEETVLREKLRKVLN